MSRVALFTHPDCALHEMGSAHPEQPARLTNTLDYLQANGILGDCDLREAQPLPTQHPARVHRAQYVEAIAAVEPGTGYARIDADTALNRHSLRAALLAAGAAVSAVDAVCASDADASTRAFCLTRPPGHHAEEATGMGFCFFNNAALAARHALDVRGMARVAILDFDVHHGNGTVDIFKSDPRVLVCSTFQHPFYPGRMHDIVAPNIVNSPLAIGSGSLAFRQAVEADWLPALEAHRPELIVVSAGFDAHRDDPLAGLNLLDDDYRWITRLICDSADSGAAKGRVVSMLEGGYELNALARGVGLHVGGLLG